MMLSQGNDLPEGVIAAARAMARQRAGGGQADQHPGMQMYTTSTNTHSLKAASVNREVLTYFVVKALLSKHC